MARSLQPYNWLIVLLLFAGLFGGAYVAQGQTVTAPQEEKAIVPDQAFTTINGLTINLHMFKGKTILVHYWASWCPPCVKEFPTLIEAARKNNQIVVIAISVDNSKTAMTNFLDQVDGATTLSNVYHVSDQLYAITINGEKVRSYPDTFIINPDMTLQRRTRGGLDWRYHNFN